MSGKACGHRGASLVLGLCLLGPVLVDAAGEWSWQEATSGIELQHVPGGCFDMGAESAGYIDPTGRDGPEPPLQNEVPRHEVCVSAFWIGRYEVTNAQWRSVLELDAVPAEMADRPATMVTRRDVRTFLNELNARPQSTPDGSSGKFRLPTEAEWEFACRSATAMDAPLVMPEDEIHRVAWYRRNVHRDPAVQPIGGRQPNDRGLHDMLGNVWEMVEDSYVADGYAEHTLHDPWIRDASNPHYVVRGGSFRSDRHFVRCGARESMHRDDRLPSLGLRVVWSPLAGESS